MRILLSAYSCEPNRGSELGFGWNWAISLAERGHSVNVLTCAQSKAAIENEIKKKPIPNVCFHYIDVQEWSKKFMKGQFGVYAHYLLWQRCALTYFIRNKISVDIIHHVTWGSLAGGSKLWKLGLPFIFGPVGGGQISPRAFRKFLGNKWPQECRRAWTRKIIPYSPALRKLAQNAALILVTNSATYELAKRIGATRLLYFLDTGLAEDLFQRNFYRPNQKERLEVMWVGRIQAIKGLAIAISALKRALHAGAKLHLTIVGDGPLSTTIPALIKQYGVSDHVTWIGQVPWQQVLELYQTSDIFLFTSLRDSFGSQILEAMAFELPVIVLNHNGAKYFLPDDAAIKIEVTSPEKTINSIADAMDYLYKEPDARKELGKKGLNFARSNTWPIRAACMEQFYSSILNQEYGEH